MTKKLKKYRRTLNKKAKIRNSSRIDHDNDQVNPDSMNRRDFIRLSAMSTAGLSLPLFYACGEDDSGGGQTVGADGGPGEPVGNSWDSGGVPQDTWIDLTDSGSIVPGSGGTTGGTGGGTAGGGEGITILDGGQPTAGSGGSTPTGGAGGSGPTQTLTGDTDVFFARFDTQQVTTPDAALRRVLGEMDFSWLSNGDSVLIKVACNSGMQHPSVTSPQAVRGMVAELFERGAGRVIVGDQSGCEYVTLLAGDVRSAMTTQGLMRDNGLLAAIEDSGAEANFFDDHGFETGYFQATLPGQNNWPRGVWLPNIIKETDHIVYLPRLGYHVIAGLSLGLKIAVGWLRDDCRHDMHVDAANFYAKYTEVSYCNEIRERYRMTVSLSEQLLLHGGPDDGTRYVATPPIVIASKNIASHDAIASGVLLHYAGITASAGSLMTYNPMLASGLNTAFPLIVPGWTSGAPASLLVVHAFEQGVSQDATLKRAWELDGGRPAKIRVLLRGQEMDGALKATLDSHGEGMFEFAT